MSRVVKNQPQGFTIIELMLAMTFIAILLLAIAFTIIRLGEIYNKGLTVKEINAAARQITETVETSVARSSAFSLTTDYLTLPIGATGSAITGGRLCLGTDTYLWNYGRVKDTGATGINKYHETSTKRNDWIGLVRVSDPGKRYCTVSSSVLTQPTLTASDSAIAEELMAPGDHNLAVHAFSLTTSTTAVDTLTKQRLYSLNLIIGTNKYFTVGAARHSTLNAAQTACLAPDQQYSDPEYCAVEHFNIVLRAGNRFN